MRQVARSQQKGGLVGLPLFSLSSSFSSGLQMCSVDHSPENRDLKSNPLLVGDLASHFEILSKKFFFPEKGAGVFKESSVLVNSFGERKRPQKLLQKRLNLFRKPQTTFCEQSLFLLVLKDCRNVAIEEFAQSVEVIP